MKSKKPIIIVTSVLAVIIAALLLVFIPRDITVVTSTSSFIFSSNSVYDTNPILKIKVPSFRYKNEDLKKQKESLEKPSGDALETVVQKDPYAFHGEYTSESNCACEIGDYIYYFRTNDTANVYKYSKTTGKITSCPMSGYNDFSDTYLKNHNEVDHNFTAFVSIRTEALIDSFPELRKAIDSKKGLFYCHDSYYVNGRVFFEKKATLYEFVPETGKVTKVAGIGKENIEFITAR